MAQKAGVKLVMDQPYNYKASDLSSLVMRLKSVTPDVVLESSYENDGILFFSGRPRNSGLKCACMSVPEEE